MHLIIATDGLMDAVRRFEADMKTRTFGKGVCQLRPINFYDLQFPEEMLEEVKANFKMQEERVSKETLGYSLEKKVSPFRHGRVQALICLFVRIFGWPFGLIPPTKGTGKTNSDFKPVRLNNMNVYPIAFIEDNHMKNKIHGTREEWL
jgi:hypothetical protein